MTESEKNSDKAISLYEVGYNLVPSLSETEAADVAASLKSFLEEQGGTVKKSLDPQMKTLAYPMEKRVADKKEKHASAYFGSIAAELSSDVIVSLEGKVKTLPSMLRFLIISLPKDALAERERPLNISREHTHDPKRGAQTPEGTPAKPISEAELDKTIEELVIQ